MITLSKNSTMLGFVIAAFENLGGRATLGRVYNEVARLLREQGRTRSEEHEAVVRGTIYCHCSQSEKYLDTGDFFHKVGRGKYELVISNMDSALEALIMEGLEEKKR